MSSEKSLTSLALGLIGDILGKFTIVHDCYVRKNRVRLALGVKLKGLFSAIVSLKIKNDISIITFNLNKRKYRLYLSCNKVLTAIKSTLVFMKAIITKDKKTLSGFGAISISKKEYKAMKRKTNHIKRDIKQEVRKSGPLVITLGKVDDDYWFDPYYAF